MGAALVDGEGQFLQSNDLLHQILRELGVEAATGVRDVLDFLGPKAIRVLRKPKETIHVLRGEAGNITVLEHIVGGRAIGEGAINVFLVIDYARFPKPDPSTIRSLFGLSQAEIRICLFITDGYSVTRIAETSGKSEATIRSHLKAIFSKTGVNSQGELAHVLRRSSLLPPFHDPGE